MIEPSCIFCKIVQKEIPSYQVYEDEEYLAFLDISQFTRGHTVVIPKNHIQSVWDSSGTGQYFTIVQKVANHYRDLGYQYVDSMIFGRKVPHAHIHLIPHNNNSVDYKNALSALGAMQEDLSRRPGKEDLTKIAEEFKLKTS